MTCTLHSREQRINTILQTPRMSDSPMNRMHWVQCKGVKCLATTDSSKRWLCFATSEDLSRHITKVLSP